MKFKSTFILLIVFAVLFGGVYFFESKFKVRKESESKFIELDSSDIQEIILSKENETISFRKDENDDWLIAQPLEAQADNFEVNRLAGDFAELKIERVVEEDAGDLDVYEIPRLTVQLFTKTQEDPTVILLGAENPLDKTVFAKRKDEARVVLVSSRLNEIIEKKVFDFRKKDVFNFESDAVERLSLKAKEFRLDAVKREDEWFLTSPVSSLAVAGTITGLLNALSSLRAREFISENRTPEETQRFRLDRPDYEVGLELLSSSQKLRFFLNKSGDTVYVSTSQSKNIIAVEDSILTTLDKDISEYRDKAVTKFYSWQVDQFTLKSGGLEFTLIKDDDSNWNFKTPETAPADKDKIEDFLQKLDNLECEEFIDPPFSEKEASWESPHAIIILQVDKGGEASEEITLTVGPLDESTGKVVINNTRFDYLFRTGTEFLDTFPRSLDDWKPESKPENS